MTMITEMAKTMTMTSEIINENDQEGYPESELHFFVNNTGHSMDIPECIPVYVCVHSRACHRVRALQPAWPS